MKRIISLAAAAAIVAAALVATTGSAKPSSKTLSVVEHANTDATTDTGAKGDTVGDVLTFANPIYDRTDKKKVGTDQGYCVRVVAGKSYECTWTLLVKGGHIVVSGPFYDTKDSTLAITGGTGKYSRARGSMRLSARDGGKKYSFVYRLAG